jgi:hypothetical protein
MGMGMGMRRNPRGSASCNNLASMGSASQASVMGSKPFVAAAAAAVEKTRPADAAEAVPASEGGGADQGRLKGMRMSLSAAQGIASLPMEQQ